MYGNEQISIMLARNVHTLAQRNINIAIARQIDFVFAGGAQLLGQFTRKRQGDAFFPRFTTQRSGVNPAMPGIENNYRLAIGSPLRFGRKRHRRFYRLIGRALGSTVLRYLRGKLCAARLDQINNQTIRQT